MYALQIIHRIGALLGHSLVLLDLCAVGCLVDATFAVLVQLRLAGLIWFEEARWNELVAVLVEQISTGVVRAVSADEDVLQLLTGDE